MQYKPEMAKCQPMLTHEIIAVHNIAYDCNMDIFINVLLTGKFSFTSHNLNVLSVDAEASSSLDKNFTYETAFLCPLNTWSGWLVFLKS